MPSYLVTGSSRGLGLAYVTELVSFHPQKPSKRIALKFSCHFQLKNPQNFVIATARNPSKATELQTLISEYPKDRAAMVQLDLASPESIEKAAVEATELLPEGLDCLVGNAGANDQPLPTFENLSVLPHEILIGTNWLTNPTEI